MSEHPALRSILTRVEKPGRYVGGEWNEIRKNPRTVDVKVALAFPDVYEIGMSYLGQKILYGILNADPAVLAERVFAPWPDFEAELRQSRVPLASLENAIPLAGFDIVGFSLLYELNYSNVLTILDLGGIPLFSRDRGRSHPLVIAGGPAAFNPEPVADFFDLMLLGDGEEAFPEIIAKYRALRQAGLERSALLKELSSIEGVYVPSLYRPVRQDRSPLLVPQPLDGAATRIRKRVLKGFQRSFFPEKIIVPSLRVVFDRVAMEAARGCPQNCRFCQASSLYFPHRTKDPSFVVKTMLRSLRQTGYEDCSLSALSISDYPRLEETVRCLMDRLGPEKISLSLSSLRPSGLSRDIVDSILKVRKTGFTLVAEAGTERLRAVVNKKLKDQEIWDGLSYAFAAGWRLVKIYFMAGLPTETQEDLEGIAAMVRRSLDLGRSILGTWPQIHVSVSSFIPKPHTPFQWLAMESVDSLAAKQRMIRTSLGRARSVEFKDHPVEASALEAVFSRGDRRLSRVLARAWSKGARFDSWRDKLNLPLWWEAFAEEAVDPADYLKAIDRDVILPWDHIDIGLKKSHLARELDLGLAGRSSPSCLERNCADCNGCDLRFWKKADRPSALKSPRPAPRAQSDDKAGQVLRYRVVYRKTGKARYLSHIDLIHVIQRSFRRAGVSVRKTQGFHPKMDFSYGPALPLGMEGRREVLEFRSESRLDPEIFLAGMKRALPSGIRVERLDLLEAGDPPLANSIDGLAYSLDLKSEDFLRAWRQSAAAGESGAGNPSLAAIKARLAAYTKKHISDGLSGAFAFRRGRMFLRLPPLPRKGCRPQDIISEAFGIPGPVFLLRRDEVVLKSGSPPIDRAG